MIPYYADEAVTLYHGDCLDVLRDLPDNSVDAVVTDPPYNLSFMAKPWDAYEGREDAGFAYWLAGLIDGEGHFAIKAHTRGSHAPYFALKMRADEAATLERIRRTTGIGTITRETRDGGNDMVKWVVQDKAGCQRLVDLLDKYTLRAKKRVDYWTWREAVCEWTNRGRGNRWHGAADNDRMASLRGRIMDNRAYTEVPWSGHEFQDWCRLWATECLRVLKPGGHMLAFGGSRTWHRLAAAVEDAGFEIRDSIAWLYGSGFPKSLDVSKAIDKAAGAEREAIGSVAARMPQAQATGWGNPGVDNFRDSKVGTVDMAITAPATESAQQWQGWGTALKPAFEPIIVARKSLAGTVAANVQEYGTGALNIDACRVGTSGATTRSHQADFQNEAKSGEVHATRGYRTGHAIVKVDSGRWPTNVVLDESQAAELDKQTGERRSAGLSPTTFSNSGGYGGTVGHGVQGPLYDDQGGASRFFPVFRYEAKAPSSERPRDGEVAHPTVKPLDLMRWLVRLVTPPGGTVLESFAGSGTTAEACVIEGFQCIAIEREADYLPLIVARLSKPIQGALDFGSAS